MAKRKAPIRLPADFESRFPSASKAATEATINLLRTESLVAGLLAQRFREHGLSLATFNVLAILDGADEPLCPAQIGDRLLVTRGTVTGLLDSLEKHGLVRRLPDPQDRRMLRIEITKKAKDLLARILPDHFAGEAAIMAALTPREQETLVRLLGKLQAWLDS